MRWDIFHNLFAHFRIVFVESPSESSEEFQYVFLCTLPSLHFFLKLLDTLIHLNLFLLGEDDLLQFLVVVEVCHDLRFIVACHNKVGTEIGPDKLLVAGTSVDPNQ